MPKRGQKANRKEQTLDQREESDLDKIMNSRQNMERKSKRNKNKNQNKNKNKSLHEVTPIATTQAKLSALKHKAQTTLLAIGNELMLNLEAKYAPYFDDNMEEMWKQTIAEYVNLYEQEGWQQMVQDTELFQAKKQELREAWTDIFALLQEDYAAAAEQREAAQALKDREKKIAEFKAQGIHIGVARTKQLSAKTAKEQKKRKEKQKLKSLKSSLAQTSATHFDEKTTKQKKTEISNKKQQRRKQPKVKIMQENDDWDDESSGNEEELQQQEVPESMATKAVPKWQVSSSDEWSSVGSKRSNPSNDAFADSDCDEAPPRQRQKKKKRGGRRRQRKETESQPQDHTANQQTEADLATVSGPSVASQGGEKEYEHKEAKPTKRDKKKVKAELRSPICVVMGHVDTGKTKILDHIRGSNVQTKEAGGITQQIGATYLSVDYIKERTTRLKEQVNKLKYKIPGLLFIDTPGHESFSNLRSRGSSMCDIAVLVVDLQHQLEPQTIESLKMLKDRNAPFVVALNKIDACYDWKPDENAPFLTTYAKQSKAAKNDFEDKLIKTKVAFGEHGFNAELYTKNKRMDQDISLVPTSAHTGEGIPDLLYLIVQLTKKYMEKKIAFSATDTKASVLEVKQTVGYGATIDVIVSNGTLRSDDTIVICGMNGPIVTPIRALLLPHEAQEMRVKGDYRAVESVSASVGVRIAAVEELSTAVAGAPLFIVPRNLKPSKMAVRRKQVIEQLCDEVQQSFADLFSKVDKGGRGVFVQASTLGSLEALITFLSEGGSEQKTDDEKERKRLKQAIPISGIGIGTISKKTVMKASIMLQSQPEYAVILAFNVKVAPDAQELANRMNVRIFTAEIIYHLQDAFADYISSIISATAHLAVFPVTFKILSPGHIFHNKNPLVLGVQIMRGSLRLGTPICAQRWNAAKVATPLFLGRVDGIKKDDKDVSIAKVGDKVSVRIMNEDAQTNIQVGRAFAWTDPLISVIARESIDSLKANFKDELMKDNDTVQHLRVLKKYFNIPSRREH